MDPTTKPVLHYQRKPITQVPPTTSDSYSSVTNQSIYS